MKTVNILKLNIANELIEGIIRHIPIWLNQERFNTIVTLNPVIYEQCRKHKRNNRYLNNATAIIADGTGIVWAGKRKGINLQKVTGVDLVKEILYRTEFRVYLIGATKQVMSMMRLKSEAEQWPVQIVGADSGYYHPTEEVQIIRRISQARPDIVLVGMGIGKQEEFLLNLQDVLKYGIGIGVGGSFDVVSGKIKRAPDWVQKTGLEWVYRAIKQPKRIKNWPTLLRFICRVWGV